MIVSKRTFRSLYIPILIEQLFILIMGQADTLMLNSYSTDAVAASGMISQILMLITFLITIIHVGTNIRIVHLKEHQPSSISQEIYHNLLFNSIVSIVFTIVIGIAFELILRLFRYLRYIQTDLSIWNDYIECTHFNDLSHVYGTVLRVMNHASSATRITIISNVTNII